MDLPQSDWLRAFRVYFGVIAVGNLVWETLQLPLYTIWTSGTAREQAFAVVHCTGGDLLIALTSLAAALLLMGSSDWPARGFERVALLAIVFGVVYTGFSEWLNVAVRRSWAYSDLGAGYSTWLGTAWPLVLDAMDHRPGGCVLVGAAYGSGSSQVMLYSLTVEGWRKSQ